MSLVLILVACQGPAAISGPGVVLHEGGVVVCDDPSPRDGAPFDHGSSTSAGLQWAELHGGGLLVEDLDGDGWLDLLLPSERRARLYWGPEGSFEIVDLDDLDLDYAVGVTAVDYDGDGDLDVFITRWGGADVIYSSNQPIDVLKPNVLLRNDGNRRFTDVSLEAFGPSAPFLKSQSASWGDIDGDGDLDLFVGSYGDRATLDVNDPQADCSDHRADPAELWRNEGDGTFTDISAQLPQEAHDGYTFTSALYDIDGDSLPELFIANDDGLCAPSLMLDNVDGTFVPHPGVGFHPDAHDMGMGVADLNGDELPDFLMTSWKTASYLQSSRSDDGRITWFDFTNDRGLGVDAPGDVGSPGQVYGWGAEFGDIDNDADLDAIMVFGYWDYYTGPQDPKSQPDGLWLQDEDGRFSDQGEAWGLAHPGQSRGVVLSDLDNDGYLDILKRRLDGDSPLSVSRCGDQAWARIRLRQPGPNTHAVGAKIRVFAGEGKQVRWIHSGSSGMYSGAPLEAHFGLGNAERITRIEVVWPDGAISA
ncbi:MAG TPA: CRTAC1 family protein, partial [Deltaproteobacteria bacterium]|nr:CRTAC1 family protein [Deltaproteobacteria bacterium]